MKTSYTPGPWQVNINKIGGLHTITIRSQLNAVGLSRQIAEVNPYVNPFTEGYTPQDNARLIAAAPELLEALEELLGVFDDMDGLWCGVASKARAAIEKAKGE